VLVLFSSSFLVALRFELYQFRQALCHLIHASSQLFKIKMSQCQSCREPLLSKVVTQPTFLVQRLAVSARNLFQDPPYPRHQATDAQVTCLKWHSVCLKPTCILLCSLHHLLILRIANIM
jgi:hypothetical protein